MANDKFLNIFYYLIFYLNNKANQQWFLKKIVKTIKYPLWFHQGDFVGFEEFIVNSLVRKETLEVEENCLLLELNRSKFLESIFILYI